MSEKARLRTQRMGANTLILLGFLALFGLASCATEHFVDGRWEAGSTVPVGRSNADRVAICYNNRSTKAAAVRQLAESECAKTDRVPRFDGEDILACSLVNPTRAYFLCVAPAS